MRHRVMPASESTHVTGRRAVATIVDFLILAGTYDLLVIGFGEVSHPGPWYWRGSFPEVLPNIAFGIGAICYFIVMEAYLGRTIGKMVTGIKVVDEKTLMTPNLGQASIRTVSRLIDGLLAYGVAMIFVFLTDKRQRLGDLVAETLVVRS